jgi:hypothetical protein
LHFSDLNITQITSLSFIAKHCQYSGLVIYAAGEDVGEAFSYTSPQEIFTLKQN